VTYLEYKNGWVMLSWGMLQHECYSEISALGSYGMGLFGCVFVDETSLSHEKDGKI